MNTALPSSWDQIATLVVAGLRDVLADEEGGPPADLGVSTSLIGPEAVLDSLELVTLVSDLEARLEEELDVCVVLADERALSQKNSPFRTVHSLTDHICSLIEAELRDVAA